MTRSAVNKFASRRQTVAFIGKRTLIMADIILISLLKNEKSHLQVDLCLFNAFYTQFLTNRRVEAFTKGRST